MSRVGRVVLWFHSAHDVEECRRRLWEACDEEELRLFGFGGYKGDKPVIARFDGERFTVLTAFLRDTLEVPDDGRDGAL